MEETPTEVIERGGLNIKEQYYRNWVGSIEYHDSKLQSIYHREGRVAFCDGTQTLSLSSPIHGETKNFKAGSITAANSISGLANVTMQASTSILYLPSFQVDQGSSFLSNITSPTCAAAISYEYVIRDHLDNGRVYFADYNGNGTIEDATELLQEALTPFHFYYFLQPGHYKKYILQYLH